MVRRLLFFVACLLAAREASWADGTASDREKLGLKGPVKEYTESSATFADVRGSWVLQPTWLVVSAAFDESGRYDTVLSYGYQNALSSRTTYRYADSGIIQAQTIITYGSEREVLSRRDVTYDSAGRSMEDTTQSAAGATRSSWKRSTSSAGETVRYEQYDDRRVPTLREQTTYDGNGRLLVMERNGTVGMPRNVRWQRWEYRYDGLGRLHEVTYTAENTMVDVWTYEYGSAEKPAAVRHVSGGVLAAVREYRHDPAGVLMEERVERHGKEGVRSRFAYRYDSRGNVIEQMYAEVEPAFTLTVSHERDGAGRLVATEQSDTFGRALKMQFFESDAKGTSTSTVSETKGVLSGYRTTNTYDEQERLIETARYDAVGRWISATRSTYTRHGDLAESAALNADGSYRTKTTYEYDYDMYGNWTTKSEFFFDNVQEQYRSPRRVTSRRIVYY